MVNTPGVAAKVFTLLADAGIQVILVTTSEVDISLLISAHSLSDALAVMGEAYGVDPIQTEF
jgi:aspartate kinase